MNPILEIFYISITVLLHYQILQLCLIGLVVHRFIKRDSRRIYTSVLSFCIAMVVLLGIPSGMMKVMYPEQMKNAESKIMKEVASWNQ